MADEHDEEIDEKDDFGYESNYSGDRIDEISDKLDGLESSISSLEHSTNNDWSWLGFVFGALIVFGIFSFFDGAFSIPKMAPVTQAKNGNLFNIIYSENFRGTVGYYESSGDATFEIENLTNNPIRFSNAKYNVWTKDGVGYAGILKNWGGTPVENAKDYLVVNGNEEMIFIVHFPIDLKLEDIKGFNLWIGNMAIRFGYHKLDWKDRLRWWIAENIRDEDKG